MTGTFRPPAKVPRPRHVKTLSSFQTFKIIGPSGRLLSLSKHEPLEIPLLPLRGTNAEEEYNGGMKTKVEYHIPLLPLRDMKVMVEYHKLSTGSAKNLG